MGVFVIACYRPKAGKEQQLLRVVREHLPVLRAEGLVTGWPSRVMRAGDGTLIEIFEWRSRQSIDEAHGSQAVQDLWERFEDCCTYEAVGHLEEAGQLFSSFETVDV